MPTMHDDLALLSLVVEACGFTRASELSGIPKSRLSRRIDELEKRLAVRLIDRSSRHFVPTPIGLDLARRGETIRVEGENALRVVQESLSKPSGTLRIACPAILTERVIADFCIAFAGRNPMVNITLDTTDGTRPPQMDRYDIALIASRKELPDTDMIARRLLRAEYALVASDAWLEAAPAIEEPMDLAKLSAIGWWEEDRTSLWRLVSPRDEVAEIPVRTRLITNSLIVARRFALAGLGMTRLPLTQCHDDIESGRLSLVLPGWRPPTISIHAIYRTRHSLQLAGRMFLSELMTYLRSWSSSS